MKVATRLKLTTTFITLFYCALCPALEGGISVSVTGLRGPLHLLQGAGGNVLASVGEDGILLVDDDYAANTGAFEQAVSKLANSDQVPRFLLNTHWHRDHTGGNEFWGSRGAVILAHANVRQRMSTRQNVRALGTVVDPSPAAALPVVTFHDSLALYFNGSDIEVQHYQAGHTDGDSVVFFGQDNIVHMGDLFFKDRFPFVDISSGGTVAAYIANVEAVLARIDDNTVIVPGHGALANKADLQRFLAMLKTTSARVQTALQKNLSVEDITAQGLGEKWQDWGKGFINEATWIKTIAASP